MANAGIAHHYKGAILMTAINKICLKVPITLYFKNHSLFVLQVKFSCCSRRCVI